TSGEGKEWERDMDIAYVFQSGPLKNLGVKWRNATMRTNYTNDCLSAIGRVCTRPR
ncbi:OprD family outer membrane porin, partial [Pseudomonas aeruginosa]|uniref:OprD family outer membrane porin n=1 Tax=Pseudomonas aeruginosa TaxID=287 RepID=UPI000BC4A04B